MIGVFDSGVGGLAAYRELRRRLPRADIIYLADREHAPYGTKSEEELIPLVSSVVKKLRQRGADRILVACCTASTVYPKLDAEDRAVCLPIIGCAAECFRGQRAGVIATEATVRSHAFAEQVRRLSPDAHVTEIAASELVTLVEKGARDGALDSAVEDILDKVTKELKKAEIDSLFLGCTHFSHLSAELSKRLPGVRIIDTARIGAERLALTYLNSKDNKSRRDISGLGRTIYM